MRFYIVPSSLLNDRHSVPIGILRTYILQTAKLETPLTSFKVLNFCQPRNLKIAPNGPKS